MTPSICSLIYFHAPAPCFLQLLVGAGAVELKNAIGIAPQSLQKKFDRRNSVILQNLTDADDSTTLDKKD